MPQTVQRTADVYRADGSPVSILDAIVEAIREGSAAFVDAFNIVWWAE